MLLLLTPTTHMPLQACVCVSVCHVVDVAHFSDVTKTTPCPATASLTVVEIGAGLGLGRRPVGSWSWSGWAGWLMLAAAAAGTSIIYQRWIHLRQIAGLALWMWATTFMNKLHVRRHLMAAALTRRGVECSSGHVVVVVSMSTHLVGLAAHCQMSAAVAAIGPGQDRD